MRPFVLPGDGDGKVAACSGVGSGRGGPKEVLGEAWR